MAAFRFFHKLLTMLANRARYHALHKLSCLEDAVSGKCPSVFVPRNSPVHEHIMRVRLCDSLLDLQLEIATAETVRVFFCFWPRSKALYALESCI